MANSDDKKPQGIEEGDPMWVESLLTASEYAQAGFKNKKWPDITRYTLYWRKGMGANLKPEEITNVNKNIDYLLKTNKI